MPEYKLIKKGRLRSGGEIPVKAERYVIAQGPEGRVLLLKMRTKSKAALNILTLTVNQYNKDGRYVGSVKAEEYTLDEKGRFVFTQLIPVNIACVSVSVDVETAEYGSYRYTRKGKGAVLDYTESYQPPVYDNSAQRKKLSKKNPSVAVKRYKSPFLLCFLAVAIFAFAAFFTWVQIDNYSGDTTGFRENDINYEFSYSGNRVNGVIVTGYSGVGGKVTIPETAGGYEVLAVQDEAFSGNTTITKVTIGGNIELGEGAFRDCTSIISVFATELSQVSNYAFYGCTSLQYAYCTGAIYIGDCAFGGCTLLGYADIESACYIGGYAFYECALTSLAFSSDLYYIGEGAFEGCTSLSVVKLRSAPTIYRRAFYNCTSLKTVYNTGALTLTKGDTANGYIAYYASKIYTTEK